MKAERRVLEPVPPPEEIVLRMTVAEAEKLRKVAGMDRTVSHALGEGWDFAAFLNSINRALAAIRVEAVGW